jgi:flagellin-like hook-associated protein FlgL
MTSDVVLTAALRNNLLSLQQTQKSINSTQLRLSTGKKVNSALDNPQSFFAAQGLNNRASDLNNLLDSIGQSIQTINAADNGVTALSSLIDQATSIANSAHDTLAAGQSEAKVTGTADLRNINDLTTLAGFSSTTGTLSITISDPTDPNTPTVAAKQIQITTKETIDSLLTDINNIRPDDTTDTSKVINASLNDKGQLELKTLNGQNFSVTFSGGGSDQGVAASLGFTSQTTTNADGTELTASAGAILTSFALYDGNTTTLSVPEIAHRTSKWTDLQDINAKKLFQGATTLTLTINNKTLTLDLTGDIQSAVDKINSTTGALSSYIKANYDSTTGQFTIQSIDAGVNSVNFELAGGTANFGFTAQKLTGGGANSAENVNFGAAAGDIAQLEKNYNSVRDQIDALVQDTGYRGTNLLNGNDLQTVFNEYRTSSLTTKGVTFTADGLGIDKASFATYATVNSNLDQTRSALESVRQFGSTLASDLAVIQTRQDFTSNLINTLQAGADALTNADQNAEGAKLLALQTRQQLGVTALSLASQSQQSILRLF